MYASIRALMASQHGLITRRQAIELGLAPGNVDELVRRATWFPVRRGVYAESAVWKSLDPRRDQPVMVARAVSLNARKAHVWSHDTAAFALGLDQLAPAVPLVHVTRADVLGDRTKAGVKHHGARYRLDDVVVVDGVVVLGPARTAVDIGREHGFARGLVAADAALRLGATRGELAAVLDGMRNWPGIVAARAAVEVADPGAETVGESLARGLLIRAGEPGVDTQFGLCRDGRVVRCDLRVRRHIVEFDGRVKYLSEARGGNAADPEAVLWEEKKRRDFIQSFRLGMSRVTWSDVQPDRWRSTGARLREEIAASDALFGSDLGDLAPYVVPKAEWRRTA